MTVVGSGSMVVMDGSTIVMVDGPERRNYEVRTLCVGFNPKISLLYL